MNQCQAMTKKGTRCQNKALPGARFCRVHDEQNKEAHTTQPPPPVSQNSTMQPPPRLNPITSLQPSPPPQGNVIEKPPQVLAPPASTPADELRNIDMGWIWGAVFLIVVVVGGLFTPWQAIEHLLTNQGVGDEGAELLAFVAGYTLPLTVGFGIITFLLLTGHNTQVSFPAQLFWAAIILGGAGVVAQELGLGLLPDFNSAYNGSLTRIGGPWYIRPLLFVLQAYFNTYGSALMFCALAIGAGAAIQVERWIHSAS